VLQLATITEPHSLYILTCTLTLLLSHTNNTYTNIQASLGLQPGVKTCLVVGGGDGVGGLKAIASTLIDELGQADGCQQVVVVCGKNTAVKNMLEKRAKPSNVAVKILGFVTNMDEWMGAVDVIITKVNTNQYYCY
jgi:UDP-N-acetylglucosamine:LPS N-acetylglucosamine transferase